MATMLPRSSWILMVKLPRDRPIRSAVQVAMSRLPFGMVRYRMFAEVEMLGS